MVDTYADDPDRDMGESQQLDDDTTDVMRRRHAAIATSAAGIADVVRRATGQQADQIERIVRGYDSEVYRVAIPHDAVVVRIRRYGSVSYASEAWAIAQCRAAGAPAPDVLLVDAIVLDDAECEVMVQRVVPGRPLSEIQRTLSRTELAQVWAQAGQALACIHSVPAGGFYKMRQPGVWDFPDLKSITESAQDNRYDDLEQLRGALLSDADVDILQQLLDADEHAFLCTTPSLLHGDFLPGHLFVDDTLRLCGVIDFGDFQGGARIGDIANLHMNEPDVDLAWLHAGYGDQEPFDEQFERRLLLAGASLQIGYLAHYLREGNDEEATTIVRAIRRTVADWRRDG